MADYYSILKKTIASLPENNGSARRNVYSRARNAIVSQLKAYEPPLSPSEITAEQLRLEEAIRKVEAEAARETLMATRPAPAAPAPMAPAAGASAPAAPRSEPYPPSSPAPRGPLGSAVQEAERLGDASSSALQTARDAFRSDSAPAEPPVERSQPRMEPAFGAAPAKPSVEPAAPAPSSYALPAPSPRPAPAGDSLRPDPSAPAPAGTGGMNAAVDRLAADEPRKVRTRAPRRAAKSGGNSPLMSYVFLGGFVLVLIGIGAFIYSQRSLIAGIFSSSEETAATAAPAPEAGAPAGETAANGENGGKNTDRLLTDTGEPAVAPDARTVTTTLITPSTPPQEAPAAVPEAAAPPASTAPAQTAETPGAIVAQKAFLYEEGEDASGSGTASAGNVAWSVSEENGSGGQAETVLVAQAQIPDRNINVTLRIKPNTDSSLPASHLVEIQFQLPEGFSGGDVSNVPGLVMKPTEEARGDALLGASVKVAPGYFWIALSSVDSERDRNLALMRERGWIDIPMLYENGKRAIFTIEKGTPGARALEQAIAAWQRG
ncbi:Uncharacterised protein [Pannonibacter phragmitetus]|uniref:CheA signal transduction histidine kinase n=1 Tax=Pannonibacter phragmitetus TaxID=121719 RepID=A0A378ZZJ3_9HYPH|nr:hypothetical protein [Pannonibacter phragmitetus]SUB02518.1 Uncharacterised protein [Pannonibacter phragmitetus]